MQYSQAPKFNENEALLLKRAQLYVLTKELNLGLIDLEMLQELSPSNQKYEFDCQTLRTLKISAKGTLQKQH